LDFHENCTTDVSLDKEVPAKFWTHSDLESGYGSGLWMLPMNLDQIRLGKRYTLSNFYCLVY